MSFINKDWNLLILNQFAWEEFSYSMYIPTLLFVVYRFFMNTPWKKDGGWSNFVLREKYPSYLSAFNLL